MSQVNNQAEKEDIPPTKPEGPGPRIVQEDFGITTISEKNK